MGTSLFQSNQPQEHVWDPELLEWVREQQATISGETINVNVSGPLAVTYAALLAELQLKADLTETQPTSLATLPALVAGTAAIGKLAANSGVDIGDVDVTSLPAITGTVTANAGSNLNTSALATQTTLASTLTELQSILTKLNASLAVTGPLTDGQLRAAGVPVTMAAIPTGGIALADTYKARSDTFTATGSGTIVDVSAAPVDVFAVQVTGTGSAASAWDVRLEGSLDGVTFTQILAHTNVTGDGVTLWSGATRSPVLYFKARCAGLTLGLATNIVVKIVGTDD